MAFVRSYLKMVEKLTYRYHVEGWFLEATSVYCEAVSSFDNEFGSLEIKSRGLLAFLEYLDAYIALSEFQSLQVVYFCCNYEGRMMVTRPSRLSFYLTKALRPA